MTIAQRIVSLRKAKGLTQQDMEIRTGIKRSYLSRMENGSLPQYTNPTIVTLEKITNALGVSLSRFIKGVEIDV
jgi:transcriptional regulator with XRE-family HTH domain